MSAEGSEDNPFIWKAQVCEVMERYEDMAEFMKLAAEGGESFDSNQRNLFSVAFKNVVGSRRSAWRVVSAKEGKCTTEVQKECCKDLKAIVEKELKDTCKEVVEIIDKMLEKESAKGEPDNAANVFYLKMKGDYYRYLSEISSESTGPDSPKGMGEDTYKKAAELAEELPSTHPIRLGLALNFSVFYYEILNEPSKACAFAKKAFDDAIADLDNLHEDSYKDSTLIMQLLRDNLTLWTTDMNTEEEPQD